MPLAFIVNRPFHPVSTEEVFPARLTLVIDLTQCVSFQNWPCECSSQVKYIYIALFHNTDCIKAASQNQSRQHKSVCLFMKRQSSLVELINGMMGHLI